MASVVDSSPDGVHATPARSRWSWKGMARRPEFGAVVATLLVYLFFAVTTQGAGFVSIDGTAGWLDTAAELGIIAIPVGILMIAGEFDLSVGSIVGASAVFLAIGTTVLCSLAALASG
jgi:simple sugar transport system permease protein